MRPNVRLRLFHHALILAVSCASLACGPIVMIPGGRLSGEVLPIPSNWDFTDSVDTFQLETRPEDPYSVNIWAIAVEDALFVVAGGGPETAWATHLQEDPRVRLRIEGQLYELKAVEANDETNRALFLAAAKKKYDFEPEGEDTAKAVLYRLDPR